MRIEKLHKNIVEHKHSQYKKWLQREEELRNKPAKSVPAKSKTVKSKAVVSSGSDGDSESEDMISKFQNRINKIKDQLWPMGANMNIGEEGGWVSSR